VGIVKTKQQVISYLSFGAGQRCAKRISLLLIPLFGIEKTRKTTQSSSGAIYKLPTYEKYVAPLELMVLSDLFL
jgi:hypothetical protein